MVRVLVGAALVGILASPHVGIAAGAVAIGGNTSRRLAAGWAYNETEAHAREYALSECKKHEIRARRAKSAAKCKIISSFSRQCFALAMDPKPKTLGYGVSTAGTQEAANAQAIATCRSASAPGRQKYCIVTDSGCDTNDGAN